jgi:hypothetical protein
MSIKEWGPITWYLFHTLAEKIKDEYFEQERSNIIDHIFSIAANLPCPECKQHAVSNLKFVDKTKIKTKENLKDFLFQFHNKVNEKTKKPSFPKEKLNEKYKYAVLNNITFKFLEIWSKKSGNMHMLLSNSMNKTNVLSSFLNWYNTNIFKFSHEIKIKE